MNKSDIAGASGDSKRDFSARLVFNKTHSLSSTITGEIKTIKTFSIYQGLKSGGHENSTTKVTTGFYSKRTFTANVIQSLKAKRKKNEKKMFFNSPL